MSEQRLLEMLTPPPGGIGRLLARKDASQTASRPGLGLPLAMAASLAALTFAMRPQAHELTIAEEGGRLIGQAPAATRGARVAGARALALSSDDPRVRIYWLERGGGSE